MAVHNEDSRVKIPAILQLVRLRYDYLSLKGQTWDERTNIFNTNIKRLNLEFNELLVTNNLNTIK